MNRFTLPLVGLIVATVGCTPQSPKDPPIPTLEDLQRDLKLEFVPHATELTAGQHVYVRKLLLVNTSKTATYRVVKEGDGSAEGRRQPYVYFTAEARDPQGNWVSVKHQDWEVCGKYNSHWQKDVIELGPGESHNIYWESTHFTFQQPTKARITAHYEYLARFPGMKDDIPPSERGGMGACPAFHIMSQPVELTVTRPLDVKVRAKRKVKVGEAVNLSDVFEVTVTNATDSPIEMTELGSSPYSGSWLGFAFGGGYPLQLSHHQNPRGRTATLDSGKTITVFGGGDFTNGAYGTWTFERAGKQPVKVHFAMKARSNGTTGPSVEAETEVVVEP